MVTFAMMSSYALGFWYGSKLVADHEPNINGRYTVGEVLVVFFSIIMGGFNISQLTPCMKAFAEG